MELPSYLKWTSKRCQLKEENNCDSDGTPRTLPRRKSSKIYPTSTFALWRNLSPHFWFQNSEWQLDFCAVNTSSNYCLELKKLDSNPCRAFQTTCFAQGQPQTTAMSVLVTNCSSGGTFHKIWTPSHEFLSEAEDLLSMDSILFVVSLDAENSGTPFGVEAEAGDKCWTYLSSETFASGDISNVQLSNLNSLSSDFGNLLASGEASDVQLKCKGGHRQAHRSVLATRSEVFSAMFRNEMSESKSGVVDIEDLDATLLDLFLRYLYTGNLSGVPENRTHELYAVADKYAVHCLKKLCSDWMIENLSANNYQAFLLMADAHSDEQLKDVLISSVVKHPEWLDSGTWLEFSKEHSKLAVGVYHKLYNKTHKK